MNCLLSAFAIVGLCAGSASADVLFVDDDASPGGDGQSWGTAYRYLQDALFEAATSGRDVTAIHVGQGLYLPDRSAAEPTGTGDRLATFQLVDGLRLAGGFAGVGAHVPDERDPSQYVTTLSGDLAGDDGPGFVNNGENSWHVVSGSQNDPTAVINGFTITGGNADGPAGSPTYHASGGGMIVVGGSPTVVSCTFLTNAAVRLGAGMVVNDGGNPTISGSTFSGNVAQLAGGGLRCGNSDATVANSTFFQNRAESSNRGGGAIANFQSDLLVVGTLFVENYTAGEGGATATITGDTTVINSTLVRNTADGPGGGLCTMLNGTTEVSNSVLFWNTAPLDQQIYNVSQGTTCVVSSNTQGGLGGTGVIDDGGNLDVDPLFVDPAGVDADPANDYHLAAASPSVGMGDLTFVPFGILVDHDGNPRLVDCQIDMGAYENQVALLVPGDTNCDGIVGYADLIDLRLNWGPCGLCPADIDNDGVVGHADLSILLHNWTAGSR